MEEYMFFVEAQMELFLSKGNFRDNLVKLKG
jgi:hypothetical protein